jgi:asparagine synthase (glutamine-hydrolysing)
MGSKPYGIKPLYIGHVESGVVLASQVKALLATGMVSREPDREGQSGFWLLGSIPEPYTWYKNIRSLRAGHCVWIVDGSVKETRSWHDIGSAWRDATVCSHSEKAVSDLVKDAIRESVSRHLVADVPLGVLLSGGVDSGALAGLMVELGAKNLQGITITYDEFAGKHEDEAPVAAEIARHYGIRHHVYRVTRDEFLADLPRILEAMDQPSIDGINTWYASKAVAELGLKVVISGVGGDELFLGYESFRQLPTLVRRWRRISSIPYMLTAARIGSQLLAQRTGNDRWRYAPEWAQSTAGAWWLRRSVHSPAQLKSLMGEALPSNLISGFEVHESVERMVGKLASDDMLALAQIESMTYMRNQLLRDSDWASMDHGVELRTPLVDATLLEQVRHVLPAFSRFPNKSLLAKAPLSPLPSHIIHRRKTGFGIPIREWMDGANLVEGGGRRLQGWMQHVAKAYDQSY